MGVRGPTWPSETHLAVRDPLGRQRHLAVRDTWPSETPAGHERHLRVMGAARSWGTARSWPDYGPIMARLWPDWPEYGPIVLYLGYI